MIRDEFSPSRAAGRGGVGEGGGEGSGGVGGGSEGVSGGVGGT